MLGLTAVAGAAYAAPPVVTPRPPACIPTAGNSVVATTIAPASGWASVRVYFRKGGEKQYYYLEARVQGDGRYWVALPKPEFDTKTVDYYLAVEDAGGKVTTTAPQTLQVTGGCSASLTTEEGKYAKNLVIGETFPEQREKQVLGFMCDGIISRINARGDLLPDEQCRKILAAQQRKAVWLPIAAIGSAGSGVVIIHKPEQSQARP
jgi:hypothetical protein